MSLVTPPVGFASLKPLSGWAGEPGSRVSTAQTGLQHSAVCHLSRHPGNAHPRPQTAGSSPGQGAARSPHGGESAWVGLPWTPFHRPGRDPWESLGQSPLPAHRPGPGGLPAYPGRGTPAPAPVEMGFARGLPLSQTRGRPPVPAALLQACPIPTESTAIAPSRVEEATPVSVTLISVRTDKHINTRGGGIVPSAPCSAPSPHNPIALPRAVPKTHGGFSPWDPR